MSERTAQLLLVCSSDVLGQKPVQQPKSFHPLILGMILVLPTVMRAGRIVLEALTLTSAVTCANWACIRQCHCSDQITTSFLQMFFPLGFISVAFYGDVSTIIFSGHIMYGMDNLIK